MSRWLRQLALATGTVQPRTAHAQLTAYPLPTQVPSRVKQGPAHSTGMRQHSRGYNTSSLHPFPVKMPDTFRLRAHGSNMPLCDPVQHAQLIMHHRFFTSLTRYCSEPTHASRFCLFRCLLGQVLPLMSDRMAPCPIKSNLAWLVLSSPPEEEGTTSLSAKKKKRGMLAHCRIFLAFPFSML